VLRSAFEMALVEVGISTTWLLNRGVMKKDDEKITANNADTSATKKNVFLH
jgi:hypothetical protein